MCDCQKYKVIKAENGILIEDELNNFDLSELDWLEDRMYNDFIKHSTKAEALQIIINSVEGDYSQLSPKLAEIAEKQDCEEEFKNGGGVSKKRSLLEKEVNLTISFADKGSNVECFGKKEPFKFYVNKTKNEYIITSDSYGSKVVFTGDKESVKKWLMKNMEVKSFDNGGGVDGLQFAFTINIGSGFKDTYSKESWKKNHPELFDSNDKLSLLINQPINEDFQLPDFNDTSVRSLTKWVNENVRVVVKSSNGDYTSKDFKVRVNYDNDFKVEGNPMGQLKSEIKDYFNSLYYVQSIQDKDFGSRYLYSKNYFTTEPSFKELENYLGNRPKDKYNISAFIHKVSDGDIIDYKNYTSEINPSPYLHENIDHKYKTVTFNDDFGFEQVVTFKQLDKSIREFLDRPDAKEKIKILQDIKGKLTPTIKDNFIKTMKPNFKASIYAKHILNYNNGDFELSLQSRPISLQKMSNGGGVGFIGKPEHYRYLTLQKVKNGLLIILNEEGVEELNDIILNNITSKNPKSDTDIWLELFEDVQGNSEYIFHPDMGESGFGMTSAEGITDGYYYEGEDRSNLYKTDYPESAKVYWFPNYMVERSISTLINKGEVFFTEAESMSNGGGIGNQNALMVLNDNKQIKHHTEELNKVVDTNTEVPAWVVSKVHRSASDLSDATHYLDGVNSEFKSGGGVGRTHKYKLGDKYRSDFDYDGMLEMGLKANLSWGYDKLNKLHDSFEDVNYHSASKHLWEAIQNLKNGKNELAESNIIEFHEKVKEETMFNPDITDMEMENGGTIDSNRRFTEGDFNKLTYNGFKATWSGYVWEIYPEGGGQVLGKFNPKKNTLFISGKKDLSNPLVKYLQGNSYVSSDEYTKLKKGGGINKNWDEFNNGGGVGELEIGNEVELELNNGKTIKGKVEKINPLKIRTDATSTQVIPNALIKNIKKYSNGGSIFSNIFSGKRSKSALAKDRKYFNASEKHEVNYATTFKRKKKTYNTFNNGGLLENRLGIKVGDSIYVVTYKNDDGDSHTAFYYAKSEEEALSKFDKNNESNLNPRYAKKIDTSNDFTLSQEVNYYFGDFDDYTINRMRKWFDEDKMTYSKGIEVGDSGAIYSLSESMSNTEYDEKYSKLSKKHKDKVDSLIRLGDTPKLALATILLSKDIDENSDTWNLHRYSNGGGVGDEIKSLKEMIRSVFAYGDASKDSYEYERYILPYKKELGEKLFNSVYEEHLKYLKDNFEVKSNVHQDSEGVTYNELVKKYNNGGGVSYGSIKKEKEKMTTELFNKCGVFFAFSDKQFQENKTPLKEGEKYISIGAGGYMPKGNIKAFQEGMKSINQLGKKKVKENNLAETEILYELKNHECFYTGDYSDVVDMFKGTYTENQIRDVYNKHREANQSFKQGGNIDFVSDLIDEKKSINKPKKLNGNVTASSIVTGTRYKYLHEPNTYITLLKRDDNSLTFTDDNGDWINISNSEVPTSVYDFKATHNIPMPELISLNEVENKIGRKIDSWKDDLINVGGAMYKKVYLRPEYKKVN